MKERKEGGEVEVRKKRRRDGSGGMQRRRAGGNERWKEGRKEGRKVERGSW